MAERSNLADLVMRCYVQVIDERAESKGIKKGDFARRIWPEGTPKASRSRWLHIRTADAISGHQQGLLVSDAYKMAQALGENFSMLMMRAEDLAIRKMEEIPEDNPKLKRLPNK